MDCEKFDRVLMDHVYRELDELTSAAAGRHVDQCQRCRQIYAGLRVTREALAGQLAEVPTGFEARVIEAERKVRRDQPLTARVGRALTIAAGFAMRPQAAMAALLLLMLGSSLLLLRPRPGSHSVVHVTEHGVPELEQQLIVSLPAVEGTNETVSEEVDQIGNPEKAPQPTDKVLQKEERTPQRVSVVSAPVAEPAPSQHISKGPAPAGSAASEEADRADDARYAAAMDAFRAGRADSALIQFDAIANSGSDNARAAELYAALAAERAMGCAEALPRFDTVAAHNPAGILGQQARYRSATCRAQLGHARRALLDFQKLLKVPAYSAQARQALIRLGQKPGGGTPLAEPGTPAEGRTFVGGSQQRTAKAKPSGAKQARSSKPKPSKAPPRRPKKGPPQATGKRRTSTTPGSRQP